MIEHIIRCDAILPDGQRCDTTAMATNPHTPPPGWATITRWSKATAEGAPLLRQMAPLFSAAQAQPADPGNEESAAVMKLAMEQMAANIVEAMPVRSMYGHLCDKHEIPAMHVTDCDHACAVF